MNILSPRERAYNTFSLLAKFKIQLAECQTIGQQFAVAIAYKPRDNRLIQYFLQEGALSPETILSPYRKYSAVRVAITFLNMDALHLFIKHGMRLDYTDEDENNVLHWIINEIKSNININFSYRLEENLNIFKMFLAAGCNLEQANNEGNTPLQLINELPNNSIKNQLKESIEEVRSGRYQYQNPFDNINIESLSPEQLTLSLSQEELDRIDLYNSGDYEALLVQPEHQPDLRLNIINDVNILVNNISQRFSLPSHALPSLPDISGRLPFFQNLNNRNELNYNNEQLNNNLIERNMPNLSAIFNEDRGLAHNVRLPEFLRFNFNIIQSLNNNNNNNYQFDNELFSEESNLPGALNGTQRNIIEATLNFIFQEIEERVHSPESDEQPSMTAGEAVKALQAMISHTVSEAEIKAFKERDIWDSIEQVRKILAHPCPQNRSASYPYVGQEVGFSMFKMDKSKIANISQQGDIHLKNGRIIRQNAIIRNGERDDYFIAKERTGLLGLTGREDDTTLPVTKQSVVERIHQLIEEQIEAKYRTSLNSIKCPISGHRF